MKSMKVSSVALKVKAMKTTKAPMKACLIASLDVQISIYVRDLRAN